MLKKQRDCAGREDILLHTMLLAYFLDGWTAVFGALLPSLRQAHGLSYELSGLLLSCRSVGGLAAMLGSGILALYLGRRRSILLLTAGAVVSYGILASGLGSPSLLVAACVLAGIEGGAVGNFSNTVISTLPGEKATRGFNLLHGSYAVGAFLSPLALALCAGLWPQGGWRLMALAVGLFCVGEMAIYARMDLPPESGGRSMSTADWSFLRNRRFWLGTLMLFFYLAVEYTVMGWMVTYFQDAGILSLPLAQMMSSLLWLLMFAVRTLGALVTGRVSRNVILIVDGVGLLGCYLWMIQARSAWAVVLGLCGVGIFMATLYPTAFAFGSDSVKGNDLGCGVMSFLAAIGGTIAPALVGFVAERTESIRSGMALVTVCAALLLGSILVSVGSVGRTDGEA